MPSRLSEMRLPRFPLLTEEEVLEQLRLAKNGDQVAREKLINCNLKLVFNMVKRFENHGCDVEDLFQIGTIGLIKAIDNFDLDQHVRFSTYAVPMIMGEIRRYLRDNGPVKVSRSLKGTALKARQAEEKLTRELGREPSIGEVAEEMGLPREEIVAALEAVQAPTSIHDTFYQEDGDPIYILDQLTSEPEDADSLCDRVTLKEVVRKLPPRLQQVVVMRFFQDLTQTIVAEQLGISQVQVSRLERQGLAMLRQLLAEEKPRADGQE